MKRSIVFLHRTNVKISVHTVIIVLFLVSGGLIAQPSQKKMDTWAAQQLPGAIEEFRSFLSIPNNASYPNHVSQNVSWCEQAFEKRGFTIKKIETPQRPLLLAEKTSKKASKTVLVYIQVDGQPVDSSKWQQDSPYTPTLKVKGSGLEGFCPISIRCQGPDHYVFECDRYFNGSKIKIQLQPKSNHGF